ncbi:MULTISPECIES: ABC transporter permease [unclassified Chelatococcus]|uniref:ABC transporter permease n=1 Tax=unclassified Chelatococcus TaxID=2638111 RepID=UPI001BCD7572|nr:MULTISPECIES: ABC transporter permease [unclassified Chelatococcus]MBS7699857.1 ABC transporter permease [Chelatococcus sp. YT9]MBX3558797.1 ABC transporter permease [Chelatococcus sp.]
MRFLRVFVYLIVVLMLLPTLISLPVALTATSGIRFPPVGLSTRWFEAIFADGVLLASIWRSFVLAVIASVVAVVISVPCAFALERSRGKWRNSVETFITGPRMIPQIVFVLALLVYFERLGIAETFVGLVIAHLVISIPFAFRTVMVSVASVDRRLEWSSAILGANPVSTFFRIVVPQIKTGMIAAFIFTFILSFNNVTMALFLSGIGERTLPVEMFQRMYVGGMTPVIPAISFLLAIVGIIAFIILDRTIGVYKYLAGRD